MGMFNDFHDTWLWGNSVKVIGVIGLNGSGKDEVVNYLNQRYGVPLISVGDIVREIAGREGVEPTRDNLDEITRRYFAKYGKGYFLKLIVAKIRQNKWDCTGISGIRSPEDVSNLKEAFNKDFILVHVYVTDPRVRFERMRGRGSKRDAMSYEDLLKQDQVSEELFHIQEAINEADFSLANDGKLDDLHRRVDQLIAESIVRSTQ